MIGGRYSLGREIGRGGMGAVVLGRDEVLDRPVAIKRVGVAPGGSSPDLLRAEREARIAASLNHPHVVAVFDLVHEDDQQWMVMEYVEGTTLAELVLAKGPLPPDQAAPILAQAAEALAAAHEAGIVHRDVKPSNLLVSEAGGVKLSDFGIARAVADASLTQTGLVTGSPAYLAPEVASGQMATEASDVWSWGATLFHALAGHPPYDVGNNVLGALYRIVHEPPPRLPDAGWLSPLLEATMAQDPATRWTMRDVSRFLADGVQGSAPPSPAPAAITAPPDLQGTQVLMRPPTGARAEPRTTDVAPVDPAARARTGRRTSRVLPAVIGLVVVALVVVIALLALSEDPQQVPDANAGDITASSTPTTPSSPVPTSPAPPSRADLESFARTYVTTASSDPAAGFALLTADYQSESPDYEGFWGNVDNVKILTVDADPATLTVSYRYRYDLPAQGTTTESVVLQLERDEDRLLIAGAS